MRTSTIAAATMMLFGCLCMYADESQIRFARSLHPHRSRSLDHSIVETFTLHQGGEIRLMADARSNVTYMIAVDTTGHELAVSSVFATAAENERFWVQILTTFHIYHLISVQLERWKQTWYYVISRSAYTSVSSLIGLYFIRQWIQMTGRTHLEIFGGGVHVVGTTIASITISGTYVSLAFAESKDSCEEHLLADDDKKVSVVDLSRCTST